MRPLIAAGLAACLASGARADSFSPDLSSYAPRSLLGTRATNAVIPTGNTATATSETAFASKASLAAGALNLTGTRLSVVLFGRYSSTGAVPSITPRIRLGGIELFPTRSVTGLLASTDVPWSARCDFVVTSDGLVGTGLLVIDDNQTRRFGGPPVTGIDLSQALDLTASAAWGQSGSSITLQGLVVDVVRPTQ